MWGHCLRHRPYIKQHMSAGRVAHRKRLRHRPPHLTETCVRVELMVSQRRRQRANIKKTFFEKLMNIQYLNLPPYPNRWMVWLIQQGWPDGLAVSRLAARRMAGHIVIIYRAVAHGIVILQSLSISNITQNYTKGLFIYTCYDRQEESQSGLICHRNKREICTCIYKIGNLLKSYDNKHSMTYITKIMLTGIAIRNTAYYNNINDYYLK